VSAYSAVASQTYVLLANNRRQKWKHGKRTDVAWTRRRLREREIKCLTNRRDNSRLRAVWPGVVGGPSMRDATQSAGQFVVVLWQIRRRKDKPVSPATPTDNDYDVSGDVIRSNATNSLSSRLLYPMTRMTVISSLHQRRKTLMLMSI